MLLREIIAVVRNVGKVKVSGTYNNHWLHYEHSQTMKTMANIKPYLEFDIRCFVDDVRNNLVFFHGF